MNKINAKKLILFLTPLIIIGGVLFGPHIKTAQAANCGGAVVCACGDTVTSTRWLPSLPWGVNRVAISVLFTNWKSCDKNIQDDPR